MCETALKRVKAGWAEFWAILLRAQGRSGLGIRREPHHMHKTHRHQPLADHRLQFLQQRLDLLTVGIVAKVRHQMPILVAMRHHDGRGVAQIALLLQTSRREATDVEASLREKEKVLSEAEHNLAVLDRTLAELARVTFPHNWPNQARPNSVVASRPQ